MGGRRLKRKVAIVPSAESGIGGAIALMFARELARVVLVDMQQEKGEQLEVRIAKEGRQGFS